MGRLAINGGKPVRTKPFPSSFTTGAEEVRAATAVLKTGLLSGFVASPTPEFYGGPKVLELEKAWSTRFGVKHSVSCNSATSALVMAVGAAEIGPGDEVIVSPYTMSATATAIMIYGGIPVFADIEPDCFCLDPESIKQRITPLTKAILTTDIHGQSSDMDAINAIARENNLKVIVDCAQAPGALYKGKCAGTLGDIGIYSLNRHKNIQCGEGGLAVTRNDELGLRLKLIRNHGENMADKPGYAPKSLVNILGFNFRMTEVEAAIAHEQLKKMDRLNDHRINLVHQLTDGLSSIKFLKMPRVRQGCTHVYYMHAMLFSEALATVSREAFVAAVNAEGIPLRSGYVPPLYLEPFYQKKIAIGSRGFPFKGSHYKGEAHYHKGLCPIAEDLFEKKSIINAYVFPPLKATDMQDIIDGMTKVADNLNELKRN